MHRRRHWRSKPSFAAHHPNGMRTIALRPHLIWGEGDLIYFLGLFQGIVWETKDRGERST